MTTFEPPRLLTTIDPNNDFLPTVYEQQMEFVRFHNGLVWQVASILLPISLAGLSIDFQNWWQLGFTAGGSVYIIIVYTCLAEWHRWLWVHSFYLAAIIEKKKDVREAEPEPPKWRLYLPPPSFVGLTPESWKKLDLGRMIRLSFLPAVIFFWALRLLFFIPPGKI